jgi:hypothetical protein
LTDESVEHPAKAGWQRRMDAAFDNYFQMSEMLQADVDALLDGDMRSQSGRRNFIRGACSLVEGYTACFRDMCQVGLETGPGSLDADEEKVLRNERGFVLIDRTKLSVLATYKMYELPVIPDFVAVGWVQAQRFLRKRNELMHPKTAPNLEVRDADWDELYDGVLWIFAQLFGFMEQLAAREKVKRASGASLDSPNSKS